MEMTLQKCFKVRLSCSVCLHGDGSASLCPSGQTAGKEHCGGRQLGRGRAHRLGQEERGSILPAARRRRAESQVGVSGQPGGGGITHRLDTRGRSDRLPLAAQVGFALLRPRGRVRPDGEAQAGHRQAEVSRDRPGAATLSQQRCSWFTSWFTSWFARSPPLSLSLPRNRCKESESPHAVTVYMLEPQTCQYVLGVSLTQSKESVLSRASVCYTVFLGVHDVL